MGVYDGMAHQQQSRRGRLFQLYLLQLLLFAFSIAFTTSLKNHKFFLFVETFFSSSFAEMNGTVKNTKFYTFLSVPTFAAAVECEAYTKRQEHIIKYRTENCEI